MVNLESPEANQSSRNSHDGPPATQTTLTQGNPASSPRARRAHVSPAALEVCQDIRPEPPGDTNAAEVYDIKGIGNGPRADTGMTLVETAEQEHGKGKSKESHDQERK